MDRSSLPVLALTALVVIGGFSAAALWPQEVDEDGVSMEDLDTGYTRAQTEAMMREIGYVQ